MSPPARFYIELNTHTRQGTTACTWTCTHATRHTRVTRPPPRHRPRLTLHSLASSGAPLLCVLIGFALTPCPHFPNGSHYRLTSTCALSHFRSPPRHSSHRPHTRVRVCEGGPVRTRARVAASGSSHNPPSPTTSDLVKHCSSLAVARAALTVSGSKCALWACRGRTV